MPVLCREQGRDGGYHKGASFRAAFKARRMLCRAFLLTRTRPRRPGIPNLMMVKPPAILCFFLFRGCYSRWKCRLYAAFLHI